jgi:hypothetical protein
MSKLAYKGPATMADARRRVLVSIGLADLRRGTHRPKLCRVARLS